MDMKHINEVKDTTVQHEACHECGLVHKTGKFDEDNKELKNTMYISPKSEHSQKVISPTRDGNFALADVAVPRIVCREHYIKDFQEVYPNEPLPLCVTRAPSPHGLF